jgi:hypothetical protein
MKTILSMMALVLSSSAMADTTTFQCEAPTGASTGMTLTLAAGQAAVVAPVGANWLAIASQEDARTLMATLISMRPEGAGFTWERLEFMIDTLVPTQADVTSTILRNQGRTLLNARLLSNRWDAKRERVNCAVTRQ